MLKAESLKTLRFFFLGGVPDINNKFRNQKLAKLLYFRVVRKQLDLYDLMC